MPLTSLIAHKIIETGRKLYSRGLIAGSDGNISARIDNGRFVITPSALSKGFLKMDDLVVVDREGRALAGKHRASSELAMHLHIYSKRPDVFACLHAHPPFATAFAVSGKPILSQVLPEVVVFVGEIPLAEYATPGTDAVGRSLDGFLSGHNAFLLKNHGLVALGRNLEEAYNRLETVEHLAHILYLASQLGNVDQLAQDEVDRLKEISKRTQASSSPQGS